MKNLIIVLSFTLFSTSTWCQSYMPIIDTTVEWEGCFNYFKNGQSTGKPITYRFSTRDTTLKNDTYRILMAYTNVDTFIMGGLREDTNARKIYGFYNGDTAAYLMYDFSFPNGTLSDTLWINPAEPDSNYRVSATTIQDFSGKSRKYVQLCCGYSYHNSNKYKVDYVGWTEGLGGDVGLIHNVVINKLPAFRFPNTPIRDVHYLGIKTIRRIGSINPLLTYTCKFDTSLVSVKPINIEIDKITISVSEFNTVTVRGNTNIESIELLSIEGKKHFQFKNINAREYSFLTSETSVGWFIVRINVEDGTMYQKKLILY